MRAALMRGVISWVENYPYPRHVHDAWRASQCGNRYNHFERLSHTNKHVQISTVAPIM